MMAKLEYTDSSGQKHTLELAETPSNDQTSKISEFYIAYIKQHDVFGD